MSLCKSVVLEITTNFAPKCTHTLIHKVFSDTCFKIFYMYWEMGGT